MGRKLQYIFAMLVLLQLAACAPGSGNQAHSASANHAPQATATSTPDTSMGMTIPAHIATPQPTPTATRPGQGQKPNVPSSNATPVPGSGGTGSYGTPPPLTATENQLSQQLFALINQDRGTQNLYAYVLNATLSTGARLHSWAMAHCGLSHACPNEPQPCQRVLNEGFQYMACGENVGYTSPTPTAWGGVQNIEQQMLNEPPPAGHRYNLLNTSYHKIGIGIYIDTKGLIWLTEDFVN
ncbi:MAG TPA: CAP domain-containing protein [Ktedonobacteraceae bacterium]|nr:CAP domain-containing protein [Ktedonobacteraceae bacterium]